MNQQDNNYINQYGDNLPIGRPDLPLYDQPQKHNRQKKSAIFMCNNCFDQTDSDEDNYNIQTDDTENDKTKQHKKQNSSFTQLPSKSYENSKNLQSQSTQKQKSKPIQPTVSKKLKGMEAIKEQTKIYLQKEDYHCQRCNQDLFESQLEFQKRLEKLDKEKIKNEIMWKKSCKEFKENGGINRGHIAFQNRREKRKLEEQEQLKQFLIEYKKQYKTKSKSTTWEGDLKLNLCFKNRKLEGMKNLNDFEFQLVKQKIEDQDYQNLKKVLKDQRLKELEIKQDEEEEQKQLLENYLKNEELENESQLLQKLIEKISQEQKNQLNDKNNFNPNSTNVYNLLLKLGLIKSININQFIDTLYDFSNNDNKQKSHKHPRNQSSYDYNIETDEEALKFQEYNKNNVLPPINIKEVLHQFKKLLEKEKSDPEYQKQLQQQNQEDNNLNKKILIEDKNFKPETDFIHYIKSKHTIQHQKCLEEAQKNKDFYDKYQKPTDEQILKGNIFGKINLKSLEKYNYNPKYEPLLKDSKGTTRQRHERDYYQLCEDIKNKFKIEYEIDILKFIKPEDGILDKRIEEILSRYDSHCLVHLKHHLAEQIKEQVEIIMQENIDQKNKQDKTKIKLQEKQIEEYIKALDHLEIPSKRGEPLFTPHTDPKYLFNQQKPEHFEDLFQLENVVLKNQNKEQKDYENIDFTRNQFTQQYDPEKQKLTQESQNKYLESMQNNPISSNFVKQYQPQETENYDNKYYNNNINNNISDSDDNEQENWEEFEKKYLKKNKERDSSNQQSYEQKLIDDIIKNQNKFTLTNNSKTLMSPQNSNNPEIQINNQNLSQNYNNNYNYYDNRTNKNVSIDDYNKIVWGSLYNPKQNKNKINYQNDNKSKTEGFQLSQHNKTEFNQVYKPYELQQILQYEDIQQQNDKNYIENQPQQKEEAQNQNLKSSFLRNMKESELQEKLSPKNKKKVTISEGF